MKCLRYVKIPHHDKFYQGASCNEKRHCHSVVVEVVVGKIVV